MRMGGDEDEAPCGILRGKAHWDPAETSGQGKPSDGTCPNQYAVAICSAVEREGEGVLTGVRPEKKRGAEEMNRDPGSSGSAPASTSLDATELLVAEILGGVFRMNPKIWPGLLLGCLATPPHARCRPTLAPTDLRPPPHPVIGSRMANLPGTGECRQEGALLLVFSPESRQHGCARRCD